MDVIDLEKEV